MDHIAKRIEGAEVYRYFEMDKDLDVEYIEIKFVA